MKLIRERGVTVSQAARDLDVHENVLRKTERIARKTYRTRNHAKADVFDYLHLCNARRTSEPLWTSPSLDQYARWITLTLRWPDMMR